MPKIYSAKQVIRILIKRYGFYIESQKGSHVKLKKQTTEGSVVTIIPLHYELAQGTLRALLRLARVEYNNFIKWKK